jgi:LuxR family maltose regulon positive regulatory protein
MIIGPELTEPARFSLTWLGEHRTFAFHGRQGQINLLKEKRRRGGEGYWYAYRRVQGQMLKRYVGRDEQMSLEQLEELTTLLAHKAAPENKTMEARALFFEPLLMPKLQLPRLQKGLLPREHLLALLDQGLEHKVTLVSAPAGYGKSTLVAQWNATRGEQTAFPRVANVTLDDGDNDPIRFWRYIIAACQKFASELGQDALELLLAQRLPPFQFKPLEMMLVSLLNDLSRLEQPGVLILDDLHVVGSPQVAESRPFYI